MRLSSAMAEHKLNSNSKLTYMYTTIASLAGDQPMEFKNSITIARAIKSKHSILSVNLNLPTKQSMGRIQYVIGVNMKKARQVLGVTAR